MSRTNELRQHPFAISPWGKYADVCAYSGFSISHIEKAVYTANLKSHGEGKRRRFHRDDVDAWLVLGAEANFKAS